MAGKSTKTVTAGDSDAQEAIQPAGFKTGGYSGELPQPGPQEVAVVIDGESGTVATAGELIEGKEVTGAQDVVASVISTLPGEETIIDGSVKVGTVVPEEETVSERKAVVFLGPYHSYSRADTACFEAGVAEQLVKRKVAVWLKDAKKALAARPGEFDHDTDVG